MRAKFTDFCIYTIKHSDDLVKGRSGTFHENRAWVTGKRLLDEAKLSKKVLPLVFCPAEGTKYLYAWAVAAEGRHHGTRDQLHIREAQAFQEPTTTEDRPEEKE